MKQNWTYKKLGEMCQTCSGGTPSKSHSEYYDGGTIPWLRSGEVSQGLIYKTELAITEEGLKNSSAKIVPPDTVSITMYGATIGEVGIIKIPMCTNQAICNILPSNEIVPAFLRYYLMGQKKRYISMAAGGAQPNISQDLIRRTLLPIVSKSLQQSIVAELDEINNLMSLKRKELDAYDKLAQSLFYEMFGDPVENEKGWEVKKYGDEFEIGSGGTPSKAKQEYWEAGNIPWIGSNMCQNIIITETDGKYITEEGLSHSSAKMLDEGTVLVALVGATIGKAALLKTSTSTNQNIAFIKVSDNSEYDSYFVFYHMMSLYDEFMNIGNGNFKMANLSFVRSLPIVKPPLSLQQTFATRIEAIEVQKANVKAAIEKLETLLAARMQYWFE